MYVSLISWVLRVAKFLSFGIEHLCFVRVFETVEVQKKKRVYIVCVVWCEQVFDEIVLIEASS